ncbi:MAG: hypothetical protein IKP12_04660 [Acholeplasmatales bacterium]|nr:hypothetical protein [Acholeplasmatales bacterium]
MDYDKIILELLDRIKTLEEKVANLENGNTYQVIKQTIENERGLSLVDRAKKYIQDCKQLSQKSGNDSIILICGDIQKHLGVSNRVPSICMAMRDCMQPGDVVLEEPPSGLSTRLTIQYFLKPLDCLDDNKEKMNSENDDSFSSEETTTISLRQLRTGFEAYFNEKKPNYSYPGPLFGMAFYITKNNIGVSLEQLFSKEVSLDEYAGILYDHFYELNPRTAKVRTSAYKDAMKNLLEYAEDMHFEKIKISRY